MAASASDRRRPLPLRLRIALWTALLAGLVHLVFTAGIAIHLFREGLRDLDTHLARTARRFFRQYNTHGGKPDWSQQTKIEHMLSANGEPFFAEVTDASGKVLSRSRLIERANFNPVAPTTGGTTIHAGSFPLRVAAFEESGIRLTLGTSAYMVYETREDVLHSYLAAWPVTLILVGLGSWWIAGRALAPVTSVIKAAEEITAERLDLRLPAPNSDDEIGRLTAVLNRMIDRLERSFGQARRFSADASHELRTPITILRGEIEGALRVQHLAASEERLLLNLLEEVNGLSNIVEGLLLLSRADAGRLQLIRQAVDLSTLIGELVEDAEILSEAHDLNVESTIESNIWTEGQETFLRQIALNLFENAIKYNRPGGSVHIALRSTDGWIELIVGNSGDGLSAKDADRIFERFYRGTATHDGRRAGHGLGLSISREIARAHGGDITLARLASDWTEFCLRLPATAQKAEKTGSAALR